MIDRTTIPMDVDWYKAEADVVEAARELVSLFQMGAGGEAIHPYVTDLGEAIQTLDDVLVRIWDEVQPVPVSENFKRRMAELFARAEKKQS